MWRRILVYCTAGALLGIIATLSNPVKSTLLNLVLIGAIGGAWAGVLILLWKRKALRAALLLLPLILFLPLILPDREIDPAELRDDYVRRMSALEGTKYHWGGESQRGIDCSGLPRRAFRDALFSYGIRHGNGRALRAYTEQWWFDASAGALGDGYRDYTDALGVAGTIRTMSYQDLLPGDLAVTLGGVHVLAYAGGDEWIQADPGIGAVATLDGRTSANGWLSSPITMHRWRLLTPP